MQKFFVENFVSKFFLRNNFCDFMISEHRIFVQMSFFWFSDEKLFVIFLKIIFLLEKLSQLFWKTDFGIKFWWKIFFITDIFQLRKIPYKNFSQYFHLWNIFVWIFAHKIFHREILSDFLIYRWQFFRKSHFSRENSLFLGVKIFSLSLFDVISEFF